MRVPCDETRRVHDRECRDLCDRRAVGYVVSGPMFVCHNHARHHEVNGEEIARVFR